MHNIKSDKLIDDLILASCDDWYKEGGGDWSKAILSAILLVMMGYSPLEAAQKMNVKKEDIQRKMNNLSEAEKNYLAYNRTPDNSFNVPEIPDSWLSNKLQPKEQVPTQQSPKATLSAKEYSSAKEVINELLSDKILSAIAYKETTGKKGIKKLDINKKWSYGDYQIQQSYLTDANKEMNAKYTVNQVRHNSNIAKKVVRAYLTKWVREFMEDTGKAPTLRQLIAMHQGGGPNGWKSEHSLEYADDVIRISNSIR
jgi:hypothetical protein